ncbi:protein containing Signal transduction response regulator, receiver region [Candidatus Magnetomorum sp. HK-1]|nr:protein containing Signal transduction response regulator, receiver region [Candidatus Magnetomorum sp. HK-1]
MKENSPSILIVDDNPFNREMLGDILKSKGCKVDKANNGKEALDRVSTSSYNIIIMDMLMPGLDGFETTRQIRKMGLQTPVIAHTSMSMKKDRRRCMEAGCDEFLPKPIDTKKLMELINKFAHTDEKKDPQSSQSQHVHQPDVPSFNGLHVLLIEEDKSVRQLYIDVLQRMEFTVTFVSNGNDALNELEKTPKKFDLIVSNMFTSGIDGLGVLNTTKREHPHILVFIYAAKFDPETLQLMLQLGADGIIPQSDFENSIGNILQAAISQSSHHDSRTSHAHTAFQVRKSQARLTQFGCSKPCEFIDMAFSTLHDAGGDMAQCRHFNKSGRCGVVLADVSGHDILSSYISAVFLGILSSVWNTHQEPLSLLRTINAELLKMEEVNYHVCTTVLLWDQKRSRLEIATAGNPGPLIMKQKGSHLEFEHSEGGGICLGLLDRDDLYTTQKIDLSDQSRLYLFSDGMSTKKLKTTIQQNQNLIIDSKNKKTCRKLLDAYMDRWSQDDDMILLSLKSTVKNSDKGFHYSFHSDYTEVDNACKWVSEQIFKNMPHIEMDMLMLSIREALLNAVEHGNNYNVHALVDVSLFFNGTKLQVDISDQGSGFNLNEKLIDSQNESGFQVGKRGLKIIHAFADKIEINGGTTRLFFEMV